MKKHWGMILVLALTVYTAYALLDTFVIPRTYSLTVPAPAVQAEETPEETKAETKMQTAADSPAGTVIETYQDENMTVILTAYRVEDTTVYAADVTVSSPDALKTALAYDTYGKNVKSAASEIAADHSAVLAVNGDFYGARNSGYVIRNGQLLRERGNGGEDLVIWADGSFSVIQEREISARELLSRGAVQVFSFGPALVEEGEIAVDEQDEVGRAMADNPRTAIGILGENHYLLVVSDGRTQESQGLTLRQLACFMQSLGAETAYNLDGGGSSTMVFRGQVINTPTTNGRSIQERSVSDIVYF